MMCNPVTRFQGVVRLDGQEIPYALVRNRRRSRLTLRVTGSGEVELLVPWRTPATAAEAFLLQQADWLARRREAALACLRQRPPLADGAFLPLLDETLTLRVVLDGAGGRVRRVGDELRVPAPLTPLGLEQTLERWYRGQARRHLAARLRERALELGVSWRKLTIRGQKSRWGSCSAQGAISLNWQLMALPARVVEYVVVHELCHRLHMDHSPAFWARVIAILPDCRQLKSRLKTIQPPWRSEAAE